MFLPPEAFSSGARMSEDEFPLELSQVSAWDVATRYHEFKTVPSLRDRAAALRRISARAIVERAQGVLGAVVHPKEHRTGPWPELPGNAENAEIDLDETLEASALAIEGTAPLVAEDLYLEYQVPRKQAVVLSVDTSLSMTGEKLALTAVALAVVLLQFPEDPVGIVAFENEAKIIKRPEEKLSLQTLIERFLDVPAQGYTHLEDGLRVALKVVRASGDRSLAGRASTVLLTDGKYTAGRDPAYLAPRFPHLVVIKMGTERASLELCRELARKGQGSLREVGALEMLPGAMYGVVKDLLRGRSSA